MESLKELAEKLEDIKRNYHQACREHIVSEEELHDAQMKLAAGELEYRNLIKELANLE